MSATKGIRFPWTWTFGAIFVSCVAFFWPQLINRTAGQSQPVFTFDPNLPKFNGSGQSGICIDLALALPDHVYSHQHPFFEHSKLQSFAVQAREDIPSCIVRPQDAQQVSTAVKTLRAEFDRHGRPRFAVRSGGHFTGRNHSTIHGGVLLDLSAFDEITVAEDRKSAVLGVGSRWGRVYKKLDDLSLRVSGGRDAGVGVGGLVLGGGISHLSPRVGMVCDNIEEYEIVLASGHVERATATHNADLWRALKGGSSNFGIVTKIKTRLFEGGEIWGGYKYWLAGSATYLYDTFYDFVANKLDEDVASPLLSIGYSQSSGATGYAGFFVYNRLDFKGSWPPPLKGFSKPFSIWGAVKRRNVSDIAFELHGQSKEDKRQTYATLTIKNDREVLQRIPAIFKEYKSQMKKIPGALFSLVVQPLPATITHKGDPNVLGLESRNVTDPTPIVVIVAVDFGRPQDDEPVEKLSRAILADLEAYAAERGSTDGFLYLNYAADWQDPISSYGPENKRFLQAVSRKYDPKGFFQKALQGGFKLGLDE